MQRTPPRPSLFRRALPDGRLHLQEGPIDLLIEAFGARAEVRRAYDAAATCFEEVLPDLVAELPALRRPLDGGTQPFSGPVARRMAAACQPHASGFVTPMAAVAGAVADHVLAAMTEAAELTRAYVNDGGDIALHLAPGESLACGLVARLADPRLDGHAVITAEMPLRGIATSGRATLGQGGRSFSLGIADAVTVFARTAAAADVAATLVANAVDLPGHDAIRRRPAADIDPDSDLGERLVTVGVGDLSGADVAAALRRGQAVAAELRAAGLIEAAALFLQDDAVTVASEGLLPSAEALGPSQGSCTGRSPIATPMASSRDLFPGPNALAAAKVFERGTAALAAGGDVSGAMGRHALMPMGPGNKSRDDNGACIDPGSARSEEKVWR